jgi:hypothetical protein
MGKNINRTSDVLDSFSIFCAYDEEEIRCKPNANSIANHYTNIRLFCVMGI